jgi:amidase
MPSDDLEVCFAGAVELAGRLQRREISAREVVAGHLRQIERVNPQVNAIVTLVAERAMADAAAADDRLARGEPTGPLHGLPVAHKDLVNTAGIRTTFGSPIFADNVPDFDDLVVSRERGAGAITLGKTNTPEFGAGSQTFNPVFGATLNPYDITKTCGGSSGGAAVALACGMIALADGSDTGGSLRNPAGYCNVIGLRPSPGTVPGRPGSWSPLSVEGPMGRTARDVALLLSVQAGFDARSPISDVSDGSRFRATLDRDFKGARIAWSATLGGLPVDRRTAAVLDARRRDFEAFGCAVEEAEPDFGGADVVFETYRAHAMATAREEMLQTHRARMKDTVVWNIEEGLRLTAADLREAERQRTALFLRMAVFFERFDFLVAPVSQVPPFGTDEEYVTEINGVRMGSYIEWMRSCSRISVTGHPALSVPGGFTEDGLPVGIQLVGRFKDELGLLQLAHAFEQVAPFGRQRPPVAVAPVRAGATQ